MKFET